MNPIDEAYKNKIGSRLTKTLADSLSAGKITEDEASEISSYVLNNIDKSQDNSQLLAFVEELAVKWPIFSSILTLENAEVSEKKEDIAVEQAESLIKENKLDEALNVVENATSQDNQHLGES